MAPRKRYSKKKVVEALQTLEENRTGIVLTGRVKNGQVVLDKASLREVSRKFPDASISFVAVNAPFDPESQAVGETA